MTPLCEHSEDQSQGLNVRLFCKIANATCAYYRFCNTRHKVVMLDSYKMCPLLNFERGEQMARPKKEPVVTEEAASPIESEEIPIIGIEEEKSKKKEKPKQFKQTCKVINKSDRKFAIELDGCGISFTDNSPAKTNLVEVTYIGEFGTKTFEIISYKFI